MASSVFEHHPKCTLFVILFVLFSLFYGLASIKCIQGKSIKVLVHQFYVGKIIDNNVGRFIKLREHRPNKQIQDRPSKRYLSHIAPNSVQRQYYTLNLDKNGFIGPTGGHEKPDVKIFFLGGSTTECLYMPEDKRFVYLVGRALEKASGQHVNAYNGGVSANESMHSLNILVNKVFALEPNIVVLMHNVNDLNVLRPQGTYWYSDSLKSHVQTSSNVFTLTQFPQPTQPIEEAKIVREFERNLRSFVALCAIREVTPVLMTQANRVDNDPLYHRFNDIIRKVAHKENVLLVDLAKNIPSTETYLYDHYHFTAQGSELAANHIARALEQAL